jgi:quinolinate synthase
MADMVTGADLKKFKEKHNGATVVCYVNSSAEVKAESDICCTSANAVNVVKSIKNDKIIFVPDRNLGHYVSRFVDKEIILWNGFCPIHERVNLEQVQELIKENSDAVFVAHPECPPAVIDIADHVCSTSGLYTFVEQSNKKKFIIGTEKGVAYKLKLKHPDKEFIFAYDSFTCKNMKKTSLQNIYDCLNEDKNIIKVDEEIRLKAVGSINKMLEIPRNH